MCACCGGVVGGNENFVRKILGMVEGGGLFGFVTKKLRKMV
jgi:hypothetical protein